MNKITTLFFILVSTFVFSQTYEIQYESSYNGKTQTNQPKTLVWVNETENYILNTDIANKKTSFPFEITKIEKSSNTIVSYGFLNSNKIVSTSDAESISKQEFELKPETKKILGYNCKKAVTKINSNTIEVWYTSDLKLKGGPFKFRTKFRTGSSN